MYKPKVIIMNWLVVIIVVAVIGGIIGFLGSNDGERGMGALEGAATGAVGCGVIIFHLFLAAIGIGLFFLLISWLFS